jgi:hypothetical protein
MKNNSIQKEYKMPMKRNSRHPRARVKWYVSAHSADRHVDGVTREISPRQAYIRCKKPFRLNEIVDVVIDAPERYLEFKAEVIWSNIYGYDDDITPRGMGVRFLKISEEDQKYISDLIEEHLVASEYLNGVTTDVGTN